MKFTYANVMSTVAMFAAVTTGTGYAASQLAANSVGTRQIKNGQVGLSDLSPGLRAKLRGGTAPVTGGGGTTPVDWKDVSPIDPGTSLFPCYGAECAKDSMLGDYVGFTNTIGPNLGGGNVQFRLTGTITNNGEGLATVYLAAHGSSAAPVKVSIANQRAYCGPIEIAPGQTFNVTDNQCTNSAAFRAVDNKFVRFRATAMQDNLNVTANLKLEVKVAS